MANEAAASAAKTKQKSYFQKDVIHRYQLDDEESFIEHSKLDEGLFQQYQDLTSRIKVGQDSTEVDIAMGKQRNFLLTNLVTGWNLLGEDEQPIKFSPAKLLQLPPDIINGLMEDIYAKNVILNRDVEESGKET